MRVVAVIPTFDEAQTVGNIVGKLVSLKVSGECPAFENRTRRHSLTDSYRWSSGSVDVVVVDDSSPDGTADIVSALASCYPPGAVNLVLRARPDGLASAYRTGFAWALERGYDVVVQMDADGSHPVSVVPELVAAIANGSDLALGARYVPGGSTDSAWGFHRRMLSVAGNTYARVMLGLPYRDLTGGFKAWNAGLLRAMTPVGGTLSGYAFQIHTTYAAHRIGARIVEIPFHFKERTHGVSKMRGRIVTEGVTSVAVMRLCPPVVPQNVGYWLRSSPPGVLVEPGGGDAPGDVALEKHVHNEDRDHAGEGPGDDDVVGGGLFTAE